MRKATDRKRVGRFLGLMTSLALLAGSMGISGAAAQPAVFDSPYYTLDQSGRTIEGVYEGNTVEELLGRFESPWAAEVYRNGTSITEGYLDEGMEVRILNGGELYGSYTVAELLPAFPQTRGLSSAGFCSPFEGVSPLDYVSSEFGMRGVKMHKGIDLWWATMGGTPIRAVKSGTVIKSEYSNSYGNYVKIDHGSGVQTLYAHMRYTPLVSVGQSVTQGQVIGYVGTTGESNADHLHFEVLINGSM